MPSEAPTARQLWTPTRVLLALGGITACLILFVGDAWLNAVAMDLWSVTVATVAIRELRARHTAITRRPFLRLAIGTSIAAFSNIAWDISELAGHLDAAQIPLGILFIVAYGFSIAGITSILPVSSSFAGRGRWIDLTVFAAAAVVVVGQLSQSLVNFDALSAGRLLAAISPVVTVLLLATTLRLAAHPVRGIPAYWGIIVTALVWGSSELVFAMSTSTGDAFELLNGVLVVVANCVAAASILHPSCRKLPRQRAIHTVAGLERSESGDRHSVLILVAAQSAIPLGIGVMLLMRGELWIGLMLGATAALGCLTGLRMASLFGDRERLRARLAHDAHHDSLTGLPNRAALRVQIEALEPSSAHRSHVLLFVDLDGFKEVNDTFGHSMGDLLLGRVATRLVDVSGPSSYVARFAGDEFVIILHNQPGDDVSLARVRRAISDSMERPFEVDGAVICIGASIGQAPLDIAGIDESLRAADAAMYQEKRLRRAGRAA